MRNPGPVHFITHDALKALQDVAKSVTVTADYDALYSDDYILVDSTSAEVDVTLPLARGGVVYTVVRVAGANNVNILPSGSDTVNGTTSIVISASYTPVTVKAFVEEYIQIA